MAAVAAEAAPVEAAAVAEVPEAAPEAAVAEAPEAVAAEAVAVAAAAVAAVAARAPAEAPEPGTFQPAPVRPQQRHAGCCRSGQPAACSCSGWRRRSR